MTYRITTITNRINSYRCRTTEMILLVGLYSRTMARQEFDAGAEWVGITIYDCLANDRERQLYAGHFVHQDQLALAKPFLLQDKQGRDCPQG